MNKPANQPLPAPAPDRAPRPGVHFIHAGEPLGDDITRDRLGAKAFNLAHMAQIGLTVPSAFVLDTGWCAEPEKVTPDIWAEALARLEQVTGLRLGDRRKPLLLSVRSGAPISMPGMMETLLNIGLTEETLPGLIRVTGNPRLAWDAYRRLIACYGEVVMGTDGRPFEEDIQAIGNGTDERELDFAALRELAHRHLDTFRRETGQPFPQSVEVQLHEAILAVFRSWSSAKAQTYRTLHALSDAMGTAVTIQRMVFGNAGGTSGAGVGFTRNPSDGVPALWVDFLFNAQGEDVVSGRRSAHGHDELAAVAPQIWDELVAVANRLEKHFGDMQDFEFTVQGGQLYMLQTRTGKRTPRAAARIALDLFDEGVIDRAAATERTDGFDEQALSIRTVVAGDGEPLAPIASAATAASGVACGEIVLDENRARERRAMGKNVILVRQDAETRDIAALELAEGLLTQRGARTSHAAVVARQLGKVCLVGCDSLRIDETGAGITIGERTMHEGDCLTLDGNEGQIYAGATAIREEVDDALMQRLTTLRALCAGPRKRRKSS